MFIPSVPFRLAAATVATVLGASSAGAACSDRPGTPDNLEAVVLQGTLNPSIQFRWRNTATEEVWWDIEVTGDMRESRSGVGPRLHGKYLPGNNTWLVGPGKRLCFSIRARTAPGKEGCTSAKWAGPICAAAAAPDKPVKKIGKATFPAISVQWLKGDIFLVRGTNFTPKAPVTIDVSGEPTTLKSITVDARGGSLIVAKADGSLYAWLRGVCNSGRQGTVAFIARDKDRAPTARVTAACHSGAEYVPNKKIKP